MAKAKKKAVFFCKECGYESPKWLGQCPVCHEWDSFTEAPPAAKYLPESVKGVLPGMAHNVPARLNEVRAGEEERTVTGIGELDRVLGGGIVAGSLVLVGGDPGIGKSTLLLQMCRKLSADGHKILYVSGEESPKQIKMRAERLGSFDSPLYLLC